MKEVPAAAGHRVVVPKWSAALTSNWYIRRKYTQIRCRWVALSTRPSFADSSRRFAGNRIAFPKVVAVAAAPYRIGGAL